MHYSYAPLQSFASKLTLLPLPPLLLLLTVRILWRTVCIHQLCISQLAFDYRDAPTRSVSHWQRPSVAAEQAPNRRESVIRLFGALQRTSDYPSDGQADVRSSRLECRMNVLLDKQLIIRLLFAMIHPLAHTTRVHFTRSIGWPDHPKATLFAWWGSRVLQLWLRPSGRSVRPFNLIKINPSQLGGGIPTFSIHSADAWYLVVTWGERECEEWFRSWRTATACGCFKSGSLASSGMRIKSVLPISATWMKMTMIYF